MRSVLLDTHTILWMVADEAKLGEQARQVLADSGTRKLMSPASYWELAIKIRIGKLVLNVQYDEFVHDAIELYALEILHVQPHHTSLLTTLELHHGDPFDRLLIAQAAVEGIPIISIDDKFDDYLVPRIWAYAEEDGDAEEEPEEVGDGDEQLEK